MKNKIGHATAIVAVGYLAMAGTAEAAAVKCAEFPLPTYNYMEVDSSQVSACVDSGVGNIGQGNEENDDFLYQNDPNDTTNPIDRIPTAFYTAGYRVLGAGTFTQTGLTGTWAFDSSLWTTTPLAIGFKFGTGNQPDEWFVYNLVDGVFSGNWTFFDMKEGGGSGLSHVVVYRAPGDRPGDDDDQDVPEPGTLALLGLGLMGLGLSRRRKA